jgi:peptidyl-prolyl cis-trans isomerase C
MKLLLNILLFGSLSLSAFGVHAQEALDEKEILAQRGNGTVTQRAFTARSNKIPADVRFSTLRNGNRLRDLINNMLLRAQLAADAREAGFDKEAIVVDRMQLAAEHELADAWLQHYVEIQPDADYEQLAREAYELRKDSLLSSPKIDVSHILISTSERSDEDALLLADSVHQQVMESPALFDELAIEYSEDPSVSSNKGKFSQISKGDMVKRFEDAAFALQKGEISAPVKTEYGYHIIRLDAFYEPEKMTFDEVKAQLVNAERDKHRDRIKRDYMESLTSLDVHMTEEQLTEMVRRQFGEEYIRTEAGDGNSE